MRTRLVIPAALLVTAAYIKGRQGSREAERPLSPPACELSDEIRLRAEAEAADAREILGDRPPPPSVPDTRDLAGVVARAEAEVAAVASPPVRRTADVFDPWVVPEFPWTARAKRPRPPLPMAAPAEPDLATTTEWSAPLAVSAPPAAPIAAPGAEIPVHGLSEWATHVAAGAPAAESAGGIEVVIDESGRFSLGGWGAQAGHMALCGVTFHDKRQAPVDAGAIRLVPDATVNVADGGLVVLGDPGFAPDAEGFTLLVAAARPGAFAATGRYEVVGA